MSIRFLNGSPHGDLGVGKRPALPIYPTPLAVDEPPPVSYDPADLLTIGEVANLLGVNKRTLRGMVARMVHRVGRQHRVSRRYSRIYYSRADVQKIREALT